MATITTKFSIGDTVYYATTTTERKRHPCPDCLDTRKWFAKSPAGREYQFGCPRCGGGYQAHHELSLEYTIFTAAVERRTIGQVRAQSGPESQNEYMCLETGVGSGQLYREETIFATEAEALASSEISAALSNQRIPWVAEQYNKTLAVRDYQLSDALVKSEADRLSKVRVTLNYLVEDIRGCISIEEVQREIEKFDRTAEAA